MTVGMTQQQQDIASLRERLREMRAKASEGPWRKEVGRDGGNIRGANGPVAETRWFGNSHKEFLRDYANADLIVGLENAWPTLDAELARLQSEIERLTTSRDNARATLASVQAQSNTWLNQAVEWKARAEQAEADRDAAFALLSLTGEAEFEVWQDDMPVASTCAPYDAALREALHYAAVYGQDGPTSIVRVVRVPLEQAAAIRSAISSTDQTSEGKTNG